MHAGYSVTIVDDDRLSLTSLAGIDLIVVSTSVAPINVGSRLTHTPLPVLLWEAQLFDEMGMTGSRGGDRGEIGGQRLLDVVDPEHPLAAGLAGSPTVATSATSFSFGRPAPSAAIVATVRGKPSQAAIFAYEPGAQMVTHAAPARRVAVYLGPVSARMWNTVGTSLFDAAIAFAGDPSHIPNQAPTVNAGDDATAEAGEWFELEGLVSDDGRPGTPVTIEWVVPDGVERGDVAGGTATIRIADVGVHVLRLEADDGELAAHDEIVITVVEPSERRAIFIAGSAAPAAKELAAVARLADRGFDVSVLDDDVATAARVRIADVVVISSSISPDALHLSLPDVAVPIVTWEPQVFDDLGFTAGPSRQGEASSNRIRITETLHPLAAGLSEAPKVYSVRSPLSWGHPEGGATVIASLTTSTDAATIFGYERGASTLRGPAPARRVGLFLGLVGPSRLTPEGWLLFDAAIEWAASTNDVPLVDAGQPASVTLSTPLALDGDVHDDGRPGPLEVAWSGPEGVEFDDPTNTLASVQFPATGVYELTLTVTDGVFAASDIVTVTVTPNPLRAAFAALPPAGPAPLAVTLDASSASDPGGTIVAYDWDFGDGTTGTGSVAEHVYQTPGLRTVTLTVTDDRGFSDVASLDVDVGSPPPVAVIDASALDLAEPGTVDFDSSRSSDIGGTIASTSWDFGDGSEGDERASPVHHFDAVGVYPVTLVVTDEHGATGSDRVVVRVGVAPVPRVTYGMVTLYEFEPNDNTVADTSAIGDPLDLVIHDPGAARWLPRGGLRIHAPSIVRSSGPATKVVDAVVDTGEVTVEAWFVPLSVVASEPQRIVTVSSDDSARNVSLNQGVLRSTSNRVETRLRTTRSDVQGLPSAESPTGSVGPRLTHAVFTRDEWGMQRLYLDGALVDEAVVEGSLANWDPSMPLAIGAEADGSRAWLGELHLVAIYDRALTHAEICQNHASGPGRTVGTSNVAPSPCLLANTLAGVPPLTVAVDATRSFDPDGTIVSYAWDFGDGTTTIEPTTSHEYTTSGDFRVALTTTDEHGATTTSTVAVVVREVPVLPDRPSTLAQTLGIRVGGGLFDVAEHLTAEAWLGHDVAFTTQFLERMTPTGMLATAQRLMAHPESTLPGLAARLDLSLTVPLGFGSADAHTANGQADVRDNLQAVARGDYDARYRAVAELLVAGGYPDAILRLGHEFNALWPPYSSRGNEQDFVDAWRHVHDVFSSVSTQFRFDWTALRGPFEAHALPAWPGDDYVDIVGLDVYWRPASDRPAWDQSEWETEFMPVLRAQLDFAVAHGKQVSFAEWAVEGVDEPRFVEELYRWFAGLPDSGPGSLAYQAYFDSGQSRERLNDHPATRATYRALFGA